MHSAQDKEDIKKCNGISVRPLNVDDVSLDSARRIIPPSLYWLVRMILTSDNSGIEDFDKPTPCIKTEKERFTQSKSIYWRS